MKISRLDRPHIKLWIAHALAKGRSQREIAQELGTSQPTISRIARQDDVRALILDEERKLADEIKEIIEQMQNRPQFVAECERQVTKELFKSLRLSFRNALTHT